MEKHCERERQVGKAGNITEALKNVLDGRDGRSLRGVAYRLCGHWDGVDELVQEACYRALRAGHDYKPSRPLLPWLAQILRNVHLDRWRLRSAVSLEQPVDEGEPGDVLLDVLGDGTEPVLERALRVEREVALARAMATLPRVHREAITLCDLLGLKYEVAAKRLNVPIGTVRSRLWRARAHLRQRLKREPRT